LKTEKELRNLERVKEQIRQDYKLKWRPTVMKSMRYKKAFHLNADFAAEIDLRQEEVYVFATFSPPGHHLYYV
jgi:hypothetical protein